MKTIIERGASWTLDETKLLLSLWGQDFVQRQATNAKRTREVYEKMSEKFITSGYERTAEQVRTRVFNMIAEYRRILKDPNQQERAKKCVFFEALHKIYQAKHMDDVRSALDDYEPDISFSPASNTISSEKGDDSISDSEATDCNETINNTAANAISSSSNCAPSSSALSSNSISNNSTNTNDNNGDSNNNNNLTDRDLLSSHAGSKRIKLESPKSGHNNSSSSATQASSSTPPSGMGHSSSNNPATSSTTNASSELNNNTNSKQKSSSSANNTTNSPIFATTIGGSTPAATSSNTTSSSSTSSTSQRHQSLLLPHGTATSGTSTPVKVSTPGGSNTPSYININSTKLPIIRANQLIGHTNGNDSNILNGTGARLPTTAITSHQLYQAPVNTFDVTSSALLIDRMFAHLSRESENMREWIGLEKERLALERTRRQQEAEREARRERVLIDTLMKFQEQWLSYMSRLDPRTAEGASESPPELKIPKESTTSSESLDDNKKDAQL